MPNRLALARALAEDAAVDVRRQHAAHHVELRRKRGERRRHHRGHHESEHPVRQKTRTHLDVAALMHLRQQVGEIHPHRDRGQHGEDREKKSFDPFTNRPMKSPASIVIVKYAPMTIQSIADSAMDYPFPFFAIQSTFSIHSLQDTISTQERS